VLFSPSIFAAYDFTLDNFTIEGSLSHSFDLPREGWSLDASLTGGHVELDSPLVFTTPAEAFDSYQYGTFSLAANKVINDVLGFWVSGNFSANTEDDTLSFDIQNTASSFNDSSTSFWVGTGITIDF